jgi:serine/threonine protein kinase
MTSHWVRRVILSTKLPNPSSIGSSGRGKSGPQIEPPKDSDPASGPLSRYWLVREVGRGLEGVTYYGEYVGSPGSNAVPVAIKRYVRPIDAGPEWPHDGTWRHLEEQIDLLAGLPESAHLVRTRRAFLAVANERGVIRGAEGVRSEVPYVVMEWVDGEPPDVALHRENLSLRRRTRWVQELAQAVSLLHDATLQNNNPLAHSDIKPGNCLIHPVRGLVLIDLGGLHLVRGIDNRAGPYTPGYAAPEVLRKPGATRSFSSDMYSLAATAFFVITSEDPPSANTTIYYQQAQEALARSPFLRTAIFGRPRWAVIRHLLLALHPDASVRAGIDAREWAERLRRLADRPRQRRRWLTAVAIGAVTTFAIGSVLSWFGLLPFLQPPAVEPDTGTIHWNRLAETSPDTKRQRYAIDFTAEATGWRQFTNSQATVRTDAAGLGALMKAVGVWVNLPAPGLHGSTDETVSATAQLNSGQGGWGVWCRGAAPSGERRYQFILSHAHRIAIRAFDGSAAADGTAWWTLDGVDLSGPVTMTGRCVDAGAGVQLTMFIDGRTVLSYAQPKVLLSPGYSGVTVFGFADLDGPKIDVDFKSFSIT